MDSTRIQPIGGGHAIEVMAIGVEWGPNPLSDEQISMLQEVYEANTKIKEFLPTPPKQVKAFIIHGEQQLGTPVELGEPDPSNFKPPQFIARNGGFDLQRFDPNGKVSWLVSVRPEIMAVNCTAYDRWTNVKAQALEILLPLVEAAITNGATVNALGLQYQDAFRLIDGASPSVTQALFRKDSRYLPLHLFEHPSLWHCHQGWFSTAVDGRRILNNVATEIAEANGTQYARIGGQHRLFSTSADEKTRIPINTADIDAILTILHQENIDVINGVLSDGALRAIGCTTGNS